MENYSLAVCKASELKDHIELEEGADLIYLDPPFFTQRDFGEFDDKWGSIEEYISILTDSVLSLMPFIKNTNVVIHIDPRTSHYVKVAMDKVFGYDNFLNEIIWRYNSGGASKKRLSWKHDVLLVYKIGDAPFNIMREAYATPNVQDRPGFHPEGRMLTDVWDISILSTTASERTGYPTQKPTKLLSRLVKVFSSEGGVVIDPYCGSGTTGYAALEEGRLFIGCDINQNAIDITQERLEPLSGE